MKEEHSASSGPSSEGRSSAVERRESHRHPRPTPAVYRACEALTEGVLYFMIIFNPWAFGTTQPWSTWVMNFAGYALGLLLLAKRLICWRAGYRPSRWGLRPGAEQSRRRNWPAGALAILTALVLAYCLVSALNARATYSPVSRTYVYLDSFITWLPHSYDRAGTWFAFWEYLGLALTFWATRDWLLGKTRRERRAEREAERAASNPSTISRPMPSLPRDLPDRLRRFLWVLCLNGAVLAVESILQRLDQSNKLLWVLQPRFNDQYDAQFGPYAYRGNAAQYFNLLWPLCVGFWWALRQAVQHAPGQAIRLGGSAHTLLWPCTVLLAACPVISTSRGGALVALGMMLLTMTLLLLADRRGHWLARLSLFALCLATVGLAVGLGWEPLVKRFNTVFSDGLSGREEIYENAREMVKDFPLYGSGPGTFCTIYAWYRQRLDQLWLAQAHDDWLETRITFGWVGFALLLLALLSVALHWRAGPGIAAPGCLVAMVWIALAGCLIHAKFDFPLQIHSVLSLFLWHCAVLSCLARKA